jgi:hypothetical protein
MPGKPDTPISSQRLESLFSGERLSTYLAHREGDFEAAVRLYRWNAAITLITKKITGLWPDLAGGFPHAPDRQRETVEKPIARLHDFRNRLAHHQPVWNRQPQDRYEDLLTLAGYIDPALPGWIEVTSAVERMLDSEPRV